jgi:hypothetical protein
MALAKKSAPAATESKAVAARPDTQRTRSAPTRVALAEPPPALAFSGRNGHAEVHFALPANAHVTEGAPLHGIAQLVVDGVPLDARIEQDRDVTSVHSPVTKMSVHRDPRIPGRVLVRLELLVPCSTAIHRTADGVRWQIAEAAAW